MASTAGAKLPLPTPFGPAALASAPEAISKSPSMSAETGDVRMTPNTILALDLSPNETCMPLGSPVPLTSDTPLALDLASVNHNLIPAGPRVPLTARALFAHNLAYDGPSILLGSARPSSAVASAAHDDEKAPQPDPFQSFFYHTPVVPPVRRWFPSIVNSQQRTRSDRLIRRAGVDVLYTQAALMADEKRFDWERRFMGYFRWTPWSRQSGEDLVQWVRARGYDLSWGPHGKKVFETASQSGYPRKKYYPAFEAVLDEFTYRMQCMTLSAGIYNLVFARIHPDYYIVVPVGPSRPVYNPDDFSPMENTFIATWYPFWFLLLAELPGEDRYLTFRREFMRISDTLRGYYIERTPYWRGCSDRLQSVKSAKGFNLSC
ncbi:hypothetical protein J3458_004321 [Metarhizium acridum]|uniref:Uncharacterized protein n=1 Tax=Metarhizium acridum (strain CQMa 102) TaxID=655827 RepID=E9DVV3_METAQ|nr:uncharacterized protein MAC_01751 [Metarhizium acridum CQMa 102]EFY92150.1 hypothetical protein MAC_01751 [Metarhizium acridum CQMa 102]KAG8419456.1 hypothetical protein J3458_004321 [Metarhizium acridum]